jgi:hypothetical protein
VHDGRGQAA